ncbi:MAG: AIM24 family protein [Eubacterium sp.]|nr:AIM24 family protein [Eubacterium sp.]
MVQLNNVFNNNNMKCIASGGQYYIYEHESDLSVDQWSASNAFFLKEMNVRKRQLLVQLNNSSCKMQAGAMQWLTGDIKVSSGVKGVGNFLGKMVKGAITGESAVKPEYSGNGFVMLEPTYRHLLIEDVGSWGSGMVLDDGLFLCCDHTIQESITKRSNISSAVLGGEGLFNLCLSGQGYAVLESPVPREELFEFVLQDDTVKIDGNFAIAWSSSLQFTVETVTGNAIGSAATGEGFVNVYRGTGKILLAPTQNTPMTSSVNGPETTTTSSQGLAGSVVSSLLNA